jgi:hypothetical protein
MNLLSELSFNNSPNLILESPSISGIIKIVSCGKLSAEGQDCRLLIRFNGKRESYTSFVHMGGHAGLNEWGNPSEGIYVGRNGWYLDAIFSLEFTLAIIPGAQKITGSGLSVFALGDNRMLGYESHGVFVTDEPITSIEVLFTGGKVNGEARFYQL